MSKSVKISKGDNGWGGPLIVYPTESKKFVLSVTTGGIHEVAKKIAELTNSEVVDQFSNPIDSNEAFCVVIDCAGVARCGTYPKMGIPTVNIKRGGPSGPLAQCIKETNYVSGVTVKDVVVTEEQLAEKEIVQEDDLSITDKARENIKKNEDNIQTNPTLDYINKLGVGVGNVINIIYTAARETVNNIMTNIIPFMLFVSLLIGIINYTGFAKMFADLLTPLADSIWGMLLLASICSIPFLSPLIVPGAILAQVMSVLLGEQIGAGVIPPQFALPAMYAVNAQVGADFVPVGLSLMEAEPETIEAGVPAFLFSKLLTGPLAVIIGYLFSFGL